MARVAQLPANDSAPPRDRAPLRKRRRRKLKYHAFLSYSHKDEEIADWLHQELEAFRVPPALVGRMAENGPIPKKLTPIFRDEHELAAADDLGDEIEAALASTQFLIVLCSPNAASSHWTNAEIAAFKKSRPDGCILAAIAAGEPFASDIAGREDEECFPPALREKYDRRGRPTGKRAEPLAADLRGGTEERRMGFLKLVAGMLGVGLDELVQRETTQRQRRFAWLAAASLAGMTVTSGLAIMAIQARDSARDQRREAEGLVAFMLGDLKDKLEPIKKLDALDGVGAKVLAYYKAQDASDLSDAGLTQRSQALSLTAQVAYVRGDFNAASRLYREARAGTAEAIRRDPSNPQRLFEHAQNVFYFGSIAADRGDLGKAEQAFREYGALADRMTTLQPDNLQWKMEVQYAAANLGFVLLKQRRYDEAVRQFAQALRTIEAVAAVDSANADYQKSLAESLAWLADAQLAQGDISAAIAGRRQQVRLLQRLSANSDDVAFREKLIPAQQTLGNLLSAIGNRKDASVQLQAAVDIAEKLIPTEPSNSQWVAYAGNAQLYLAEHYLLAGNRSEAAAHVEAGCRYAESLKQPGGAAVWRALQGSCLSQLTRLALARGDSAAAVAYSARASDLVRSSEGADTVNRRYAYADSLLLAGDSYRAAGDIERARLAWQRGLALAQSKLEQPGETAIHAELLDRVGQSAQAARLRTALTARGIRNAAIL